MQRDIEKILDRYNRQYMTRTDGKGAFYASDIIDIMEVSRKGNDKDLNYDIICNSLSVGFIVGYDCRKREESKARKEHRQSMTPERLAMIENITGSLKDIPDHRLKALECWVAQYREEGIA